MIPGLSVLPVPSNRLTHVRIVFASGTVVLRGIMNIRRKALFVIATTDLLITKYARTANPSLSKP